MTTVDTTQTLIVPFAFIDDPAALPALTPTALPHLHTLLHAWTPGPLQIQGEVDSLNAPHEQALAHALGWHPRTDGTLPLAAHAAGLVDQPCAWWDLCHWQVGMEQVRLQPASPREVSEAESLALLEALRPWAAEDGIRLVHERPGRWRATGEVFANQPWASLDRVAHRRLDGWLPDASRTPQARPLLRLQNEAQMLFYTHAVNDARAGQGQALLNGLWISGCGVLRAEEVSDTATPVDWDERLRPAAWQGDWLGWAAAWRALDEDRLQPWLARAQAGEALALTLCGERGWRTWHSPALRPRADSGMPWWRRWWPPRTAPQPLPGILAGL
jgi:hypothetical protein